MAASEDEAAIEIALREGQTMPAGEKMQFRVCDIVRINGGRKGILYNVVPGDVKQPYQVVYPDRYSTVAKKSELTLVKPAID
jgi:hypothetical protein